MARLINLSQSKIVLAENLLLATSLWARTKGLLGRNTLATDAAMLIARCRSIHTCFMQFPIQAVFVDKNLKIIKISQHIKPWRITWPVWQAHAVIEFHVNNIARSNIKLGDQLHVDY